MNKTISISCITDCDDIAIHRCFLYINIMIFCNGFGLIMIAS